MSISNAISALKSILEINYAEEVALLGGIEALFQSRDALSAAGIEESPLGILMSLDRLPSGTLSALEACGVSIAELEPLSEKIRAAYEDAVPESLKKLLRNVGDFEESPDTQDPGLLKWKVADKSATAPSVGALLNNAGVGGKITLDLEAGDIPPAPVPFRPNLLRIGGQGTVNGSTGASYSVIEASASGEGQGRVDYWFHADASQLYAQAAAQSLSKIPTSISLESVEDALSAGMHALQLNFSGALNAEAKVDYGIWDAASSLVNANAGLQVGFNYKAEKQYVLNIWRDEETNKIGVNIHRNKNRESSSSVNLGLVVDASALKSKVYEEVIEPNLAEYKTVYDEVKPYLTPGTLLEEKLESVLLDAVENISSDESVRGAIKLALGQDVNSDDLKKEVRKRIVDWLNLNVAVYSAINAETLPKEAAEYVCAEIASDLPDSVRELISENVKGAVSSLQQDFKEEIEGRLDTLGENSIDQIIDDLKGLGQKVEKSIDGVAEKLDKAVEGLRSSIEIFDKRVREIAKALEDAAKRKVKLSILSSEKKIRNLEADLTLLFDPGNVQAKAYFDELTEASMDKFKTLLEREVDGVELIDGNIKELFGFEYETGVELSLLGISLGSRSIVHSSVQVDKDASGNVSIESRLEVGRVLSGFRETQSTKFISYLTVSSLKNTRNLPISLTVSKEDEQLKQGELEDFLGDLTTNGLLSPSAKQKAIALYQGWREAPDKKDINAHIAVSMQIQGPEVEALIEYADESVTTNQELVAHVLRALSEFGVFSQEQIQRAAKAVRQCSSRYKKFKTPELLFAEFNPAPHSNDRPLKGRKLFFDTDLDGCFDHPRINVGQDRDLQNARKIHLFVRSWMVLVRNIHELYHLDPAAMDEPTIERKNELLSFCLHRWLKVKQYFLFHPDDEVSTSMQAFIGLLSEACGTSESYPLSITMDMPEDTEEPQLFG